MEAPCEPAMARWLRGIVPRSRQRAGRAGLKHDLADDMGKRLFQQQEGRCAVSGLAFSLTMFPGVLVKHPFAPSLDRISSRAGYAADNVRFVCIAVNFGLGQWGEELYLTFARAAVERSGAGGQVADGADQKTGDQGASNGAGDAWRAAQRERIAAAETIASVMSGELLLKQRRRIASLKRNLRLGQADLKAAAGKALLTRASVLSRR